MGLGCFAVPIVVILVLAVLGFAVSSIFQGIAAAEVAGALLTQTLLLPVMILAGILGGVGLALAAPGALRLYARLRNDDRLLESPERDTPAIEQGGGMQVLPAPTRSVIVRRPARRRVRVNMDLLK